LAAHTRELARTYGIRAPELRPEVEVIQVAQARLQAQQQAAQQAEAQQMAETASKFAPQIQQQVVDQAQGGAR
jgi:bisphosphoglycerate-dependent phosphoglycerate mutase